MGSCCRLLLFCASLAVLNSSSPLFYLSSLSYPPLFQHTQTQRPRSPPLPDVIKNAPSRPPGSSPPPKSCSQLKKSSSDHPNTSAPKLASMLLKEEASTSRTHHHTVTAGKSNSTLKTLAKPGASMKSLSGLQSPKSTCETPTSKAARVPAVRKSASGRCVQVRINGMKPLSSSPTVPLSLPALSCESALWALHRTRELLFYSWVRVPLGCHLHPWRRLVSSLSC